MVISSGADVAVADEMCIVCRLNSGNPTALLPLYNYTFMLFNVHFTEEVLDFLGDGLCTKSDVRFMECIYRVGNVQELAC